jgi:hypothetical protein
VTPPVDIVRDSRGSRSQFLRLRTPGQPFQKHKQYRSWGVHPAEPDTFCVFFHERRANLSKNTNNTDLGAYIRRSPILFACSSKQIGCDNSALE